MKKLLLLGCLLAFSAPAFAASHRHHKIHFHQHKQKMHKVKIHNGTPNHRRAGT
ncbi:MAG: hypothetical protein ACLGXA_18810 [Acidobacteriota bacterium]